MASGKLVSAALAATTATSVYTVPALKTATFNVCAVNRGTSVVTFRLSIGAATPANADFIEYDVIIPANGVLERTALMATAGEVVVAYASAATVSIRIYGIEE